MSGSGASPMMVQYLALKQEAGDCLLFYRMGDFFELFFDDARHAAQVLDIALTSRGEHMGLPIPMCGVPVHSAEGYLARLIKAGCRVAIAEQVETPEEAKKRGGSKALVARDIVRFVTAGTLTEEALLEPRRANMLAAVCEVRGICGIAACDISTGRMELEECAPDRLGAALARLGASELVAPDGWELAPAEAILRPARDFGSDSGEARLKAVHQVATLDGFGLFTRPMLAAAGGLIAYLDHAGRGKLPLLLPPVARSGEAHLAMDEATRASLEILVSSQGGRKGSLVEALVAGQTPEQGSGEQEEDDGGIDEAIEKASQDMLDAARSGNWARAHEMAQADDSLLGSWLHGILHIHEGDLDNAGYWYAKARRNFAQRDD